MFHGSMVAIVTPMTAEGEIDYERLRHLVEWQIENETDGIVVLGTTGESPTINAVERKQIIQHTIEQVNNRVPVIVGTGVNATRISIAMTIEAMELGADAALVVTPYYNKPTQKGLLQHFGIIAEAASLPIILYNVPGRTGCDLLPETVERLAAISNVVGLKEATGSIDRMRDILQRCGESIDLYSGDDNSCTDFMLSGGKGVISVAANIAPKAIHDLSVAALRGDREQAKLMLEQLQPLFAQLVVESNPIPVKWAAYELGLVDKGIRLPLTSLARDYRQPLKKVLQQVGLLKGVNNETHN